MRRAHGRERSAAIAIIVLGGVLALIRPAYFSPQNLNDLVLANIGVLTVALGTTLVIIAGEIDISVGSIFAVCSVAAGAAAVHGMPGALAAIVAFGLGACLGLLNGALVASIGIPSIV